ncbi:MAG: hypothetical protein IPN27_00130 [Cellvibrionales bacterium]|jgi:hypothetical protein|nr:hypothetical protein [Cellvibrionales bacterium]
MNKQIVSGIVWRLMPAFLAFTCMHLANILWEPLGCTGNVKMISGCNFKGHDVTIFIGSGIFWGYLLWLPFLLLGILGAGKHVQEKLLSHGQTVPAFNYRDVYKVSLKSLLIWVVVSGVGACAVLVALYPKQPESLIEWVGLLGIWVPLWSAFSWFSEKVKQ